jgi:hypothetical protein
MVYSRFKICEVPSCEDVLLDSPPDVAKGSVRILFSLAEILALDEAGNTRIANIDESSWIKCPGCLALVVLMTLAQPLRGAGLPVVGVA